MRSKVTAARAPRTRWSVRSRSSSGRSHGGHVMHGSSSASWASRWQVLLSSAARWTN